MTAASQSSTPSRPSAGGQARPPAGRSVGVAALVGTGVAGIGFGVLYAIIAIPFYLLARVAEPGQGLDRPVIRDGILQVALPAALVLGLVCGAVVGVWYARGGRLPTE